MWLKQLMLMFIFAALLSAAFIRQSDFFFTWIAFVPLLFALEKASLKRSYLLGLFGGLVAYAMAMYWMVDFIVLSKGLTRLESTLLAFIVWLYCAHQIAAITLIFQWLRRATTVSEFLLFPIIVAAMTVYFPVLFPMKLAETQSDFLPALQATQWVGTHGLDALIALVNIIVFYSIHRFIPLAPRGEAPGKLAWLIAGFIVIVWFSYGHSSYRWWQQETTAWDKLKVGIVQPNETPTLGKTIQHVGYSLSFPPEMHMTERLSELGAKIVVWPEAQPKGYLNHQQVQHAFAARTQDLAVQLIFQDTSQRRNALTGKIESQYNTAIMIDATGSELGQYQKLKRIPFGEYLPWFVGEPASKAAIKRWLGDFLNEIQAGDQFLSFDTESATIIPLICYETTFPAFVGTAVHKSRLERGQTDRPGGLLLGLSNDGWFGSSIQPYQHIMSSTLRAVENRLPLVHVTNNGPSIVVSPSGDRLFESDFRRAAGYLVDVPISNKAQGSFYSQHPALFDRALLALLILICGLALVRSATIQS
ncbi:apolipoprotein N-acyltransferase [Arenicella xantha]|uniref:Apolipoprotein N-acyltransferase n=2 Tax=Arenicella xantha TaxID=644221 RepID=A0A395JPP8_9GAMM|nr:apolipoprotein N-acyltransferase [Arenicella xantha]